ncbi:unnamed protein product [Penicillium salamii]|uniref:AB hydrolase-1 domain-containing protein n=1 Tax=Penicillium salamii TaxID=1612424 RepID=A0A9W4IWP8_9EURO|nr:unnamed protein product [Penicillium salamii]
MGFATTDDGQEIYFRAHGTKGPLLVFVSGYFGVDNIWQPLIAKLSSQYRCISYDSRGYGRSSKPVSSDSYSVTRHAADLHTVLGACNVTERVLFVTHSMGCNIAAAYYLAYPDSVTGMINSAAYYDGDRIQKFVPGEAFSSGADIPSQCVAFYTNMGLDEETALEAAKWPAHGRRNNAHALMSFTMEKKYPLINVPALVVLGQDDAATPEELVTPIVQEIPTCKLEVLKGVRHFPPTEAPEEMERLIRVFVEGLSR